MINSLSKATIEDHFKPDYRTFYNNYLPDIKTTKGKQSMALCCFHEDHIPSLSINNETGQYKCFGCGNEGNIFNFYAKLQNLTLPVDYPKVLDGIAKEFSINNGKTSSSLEKTKSNVVAQYDYKDKSGKLLFQIERLEPKSFRVRRQDEKGNWVYGKGDISIVPYNLPNVIIADKILIVEGEKDVDNLTDLGFVATCNPFGAGKWSDDFSRYFNNKTIIIIPDNDEAGRKHAQQVYSKLEKSAWEIKLLSLEGLPEKGDVSDFISSFKNKTEATEQLLSLIKDAPLFHESISEDVSEEITSGESSLEERKRRFHFRSAADLCSGPSITDWIVKDILEKDSTGGIFSESGVGKTFVALNLGLCIATGIPFLENEIREIGSVFYIAGEGFSGYSRRIKAWSIKHNIDLKDVPFYMSNKAAQFLNFESAEEVVNAVKELQSVNGNPVLIIIDTLARNYGPGDENSTADMNKFISVIDEQLRNRFGCAVLIVHHTGLAETNRARGSSVLRAALDFEYRLQTKGEGIRILSCTKCKDHEEISPISLKLEIITLTDWIDPEDGSVMTSCVLVRTDGQNTNAQPLSGPQQIAYDSLVSIGGNVHIDVWRQAAYQAGVSPSDKPDTKKKAFQRALKVLLSLGYIETKDNINYYPKSGTGTITGQQGDMSLNTKGDKGDTLL